MLYMAKGKYQTRIAESQADIEATQQLRYRAFGLSHRSGIDCDAFDEHCHHFLIEDRKSGALLCCFRIMHLNGGAEIGQSYSAQYYELSSLNDFTGNLVELGRFCIDPKVKDPDILRVAWGAITKYVDEEGVDLLFGCTSFQGTDASTYYDAFAVLRDKHMAPKRWMPRVKAPKVFKYANRLRRKPNMKNAMQHMPPLLKTYLMMGGWVSDHAVVDNHMNTLHVFTGVEINAIPPARKRLLRALTG